MAPSKATFELKGSEGYEAEIFEETKKSLILSYL